VLEGVGGEDSDRAPQKSCSSAEIQRGRKRRRRRKQPEKVGLRGNKGIKERAEKTQK
jgi:hypothetical protein